MLIFELIIMKKKFKKGGKKKFYTFARLAALARVRLSALPGGVNLGACVTLTRLQRPVQLGRKTC